MWTVQVVVVAVGVDQFARVMEVDELMFVEAFVAQLAVEAFDIAVLRRLAWRDEAVMDGVFMRPALQRQARELGSVVREPTFGLLVRVRAKN